MVFSFDCRGVKRQTAYPCLKSFDSFLATLEAYNLESLPLLPEQSVMIRRIVDVRENVATHQDTKNKAENDAALFTGDAEILVDEV